ncbi:DNA ligase 6 isoform X2 [Oryza sativa Japonica Group]|uniref:DNA ligase 6 isoform X2 n=1 Tax=Oryza sativa subsp. japonica TaxID=39947 RepID=UPI0027ACC5B2|nr:hypothetical protein DAI22_01g282300 [Oryza sativa Japonica Group]
MLASASPWMGGASSLWMLTIAPVPFNSSSAHLDQMRRDTTYCNPKFTFPPQKESLEYVVNSIKRVKEESRASGERVLCLIATYVVGKERILLEVARRCGCKIHVDSRKMEILTLLGIGGEDGVFTEDAAATDVHVTGWNILGETWPYFRPNFVKMKEIMVERGYNKAVGFVPTGWMYETKKEGFAVRTKDSLEIHLVPYSEHSSYNELRDYVKFLHPKRVIPTVGLDGGKLDSKEAFALQKHFAGLVDETANKQEFLMAFHRSSRNATLGPEDAVTGLSQQEGEVQELEEATLLPASLAFERSDSFQEKITVEMKKELSDFLPSWVSQDLILDLLIKSGGDVVQAATDFFEKERDFFEEANVYNSETPKSEIDLSSDHGSSADASSQQEVPLFSQKPMDHSSKLLNLNAMRMKSNLSKRERKRGSNSADKPKKKGRSTAFKPLTESSGRKQSTITNYFARTMLAASKSDTSDKVTVDANQNNVRNDDQFTEVVESEKQSVSQLLQIVDGGMSRESAISLLEKAKGDVNVAVDIFYSKTDNSNVLENDMNIVTQNTENEMTDKSSSTGLLRNSSEATPKMPNLCVQSYVAQADSVCISLPIEKYLPIEHACWTAGQPAPYLHLARTFDLVEREKGKIKTTAMLCNMFRSLLALSPDDVLPAVYLCTNKISPDHENIELNIGGSLVVSALEEALGSSRSKIHEMYKTFGDLGDVAQECRQNQMLLAPPRPLSIRDVFSTLRKLSGIAGSGSTGRRKILVLHLIRSCREMEMKFLVRTLVRNLRIGVMMKTILPALAHAVVIDGKYSNSPVLSLEGIKPQLQELSTEVAEAYNVIPNLDLLIPSLLREDTAFSASSLAMITGTPIPPMLARITNGLTQSLKLFNGRAFTCEYKYDGQRAQIHRSNDGSVQIFSRQMKESTSRFPDLVGMIKELCSIEVSSFILDAEVVGIDRKKGNKLMSFQELSSRERGSKHSSIAIQNIKVDICVFVFDIMFCNGQSLLNCSLRQRRKYIHDLFQEKPGHFELAQQLTVEADEASVDNSTTLERMNTFFKMACQSSCEGIMLKILDVDAGYSASKRCDSWLKVKRDYVGLGDSLDLVPIGAWYGNGRKAGWYSPFLMACYNPEYEEFQSVCRVMSGFSDEFYKEMKEFYSGDRILPKKPVYYKTDELPELWFSAEQVWEIRGADLTLSPVHHAAIGLVHPSRGISVRMPRYIRSRPDRSPEDCSTATDVASLFKAQTRKMEVSSDGQDTSH